MSRKKNKTAPETKVVGPKVAEVEVAMKLVQKLKTEDGREWLLMDDGRIYRQTGGFVTAMIEDTVGFQRANGVKCQHKNLLQKIDSKIMPTKEEMVGVFLEFFDRYDHEVLCWFGFKKGLPNNKRELIAYVPKQKCTSVHVDVEEEELDVASKVMEIVGNIHSHPGKGIQGASQTDITDMKRAPGLHGIFSTDRILTWYASVRGEVFPLGVWDLRDTEEKEWDVTEVVFFTQNGDDLDDLITGPFWGSNSGANFQSFGGSDDLVKYMAVGGKMQADVVPFDEMCVVTHKGKIVYFVRKGEAYRSRGAITNARGNPYSFQDLEIEDDWKPLMRTLLDMKEQDATKVKTKTLAVEESKEPESCDKSCRCSGNGDKKGVIIV